MGLLCHSASLNKNLTHAAELLSDLLGKNLTCLFAPQHGFAGDRQDNMVASPHFHHPYFEIPVYSLYGENLAPSEQMLREIDTLLVDLQDVGTRVYTYISTLGLAMEACAQAGKRVVLLDRPNPAGPLVEGAMLGPKWKSLVGHHPLPQRHGLTMGEVALWQKKLFSPKCDLQIVKMQNYRKSDLGFFESTWINPSPNLASSNAALTYPGTVLFEGTNLSEGRGTTRPLEMVGAEGIEPFAFRDQVESDLNKFDIRGVTLRPVAFRPCFHKAKERLCGGLHIVVTDPSLARTWRLGQLLLRHFKKALGQKFAWNREPYEYQFKGLAIDFINGGEELKHWVEGAEKDCAKKLVEIEKKGMEEHLKAREDCLLYQ